MPFAKDVGYICTCARSQAHPSSTFLERAVIVLILGMWLGTAFACFLHKSREGHKGTCARAHCSLPLNFSGATECIVLKFGAWRGANGAILDLFVLRRSWLAYMCTMHVHMRTHFSCSGSGWTHYAEGCSVPRYLFLARSVVTAHKGILLLSRVPIDTYVRSGSVPTATLTPVRHVMLWKSDPHLIHYP